MVQKSAQIFLRFLTIHVCDRQMDGQTEFSLLDRVCIPCSAVKTVGAETSNLACSFITRGTNKINAKLGQMGSGGGHMTYF